MLAVFGIIPILRLIRIHNCLIAGVGVWMGWYLAGDVYYEINIYLAALAAAFVCGAGNAFNDLVDIETDRINHPTRPLPNMELPPYIAVLLAIVLNITAIILAAVVNWKVLIVVIFAETLLLAYNVTLKKLPLWGNISVSLLGALTFISGSLIRENPDLLSLPGPMVPAVFAFLFHFGRELVKDVQDQKWDSAASFRTLPSIIHRWLVHIIIGFLFFGVILLTLIPISNNWYASHFNDIVIYLVDLPLALLTIYLFAGKRPERYKVTSNILKVLMLAGLIAFYLGKNGTS